MALNGHFRPLWAAVGGLLGLVLTLAPGTAYAQERRVPNAAELRLSYAPVVQHVAPAVVNVYAAKTVQTRNPLLEDPIFRRFFGVPGGIVSTKLSSSVIVGINVIQLPSGTVKAIVTTADNQQTTIPPPFAPSTVVGRRTSWRELIVE